MRDISIRVIFAIKNNLGISLDNNNVRFYDGFSVNKIVFKRLVLERI